jgi:hypothetical protein
MKEPNERLHVLWMRTVAGTDKMPAYKERWRLIKLAIEVLNPDIVFLDGVRDVIGDFNNNEQSAELVQELMALAEKRGICIWNALHLNPRPGNDDESKMRGHLGTELGNKVSDTFISIKKKDATGVTFTVKQQDARGKDIDDWKFQITDDAGNLGVPKIITSGSNLSSKSKEQPQYDKPQDIREWIEKAKDMYEWPMDRKTIKETIFKEIGGVTNSGRLQADLNVAINMGYLEESTMKTSRGGYMLQIPEDLPF